MSAIRSIISLRWALRIGTLRKSSWQVIAAILSLIMGVSAVIACWSVAKAAAVWMSGAGPDGVRTVGVVMVCMLSVVSLLVIFIQMMIFGQGTSLGAQRFELYGIPDRELQAGLYLAALTGPASIFGMACFLAVVPLYGSEGFGVMLAATLGAVLGLMTLLGISRMFLDLATTLVNSGRMRNAFYIVSTLFLLMCAQSFVISSNSSVRDIDLQALGKAAGILAWTPLGAAFRLPQDVVEGTWVSFAGRVLLELVTLALCGLVGIWCLRHARLRCGHEAVRRRGSISLGAFRRVPDSAMGATAARLLIYLRQDTRRGVYLFFPILFMVFFAFQVRVIPLVIWIAPIMGAVIMTTAEANNLAYDGKGLTMDVMCGVRGVDDRRGRGWITLCVVLPYMLILCLICMFASGYWRNPLDLAGSLDLTCLTVGLVLSGFGVAQVVSTLLIYPVASMDRPFSSPQGRAVAQSIMPLIQMLVHCVVMVPTLVVAILVLPRGSENLLWLLAPTSLINGLVVYLVGIHWGGKLFDRRQLAIIRTLDGFATLQA